MSNAWMSLCTQSVHYLSFPSRPLRTAPSRFPNTIFFGSRPPLIQMSAPVHKRLLVRNVLSILSHRVISRARLYEVIRSMVWSLALCPDDAKQDPMVYGAEFGVVFLEEGPSVLFCGSVPTWRLTLTNPVSFLVLVSLHGGD